MPGMRVSAYELRSRVSEHASRLQSPSSSTAISITAAFAGVLDADSLKLVGLEDAKLAVPASVTVEVCCALLH